MYAEADAANRQSRFAGNAIDPVLHLAAQAVQVERNVEVPQLADRRQGGAQADRVAPVRAGDEHATCRLHHVPFSHDGGHRVAVGDRLGKDGQIRRHPGVFLNAAKAEAESG
jgi:hypothetical protein